MKRTSSFFHFKSIPTEVILLIQNLQIKGGRKQNGIWKRTLSGWHLSGWQRGGRKNIDREWGGLDLKRNKKSWKKRPEAIEEKQRERKSGRQARSGNSRTNSSARGCPARRLRERPKARSYIHIIATQPATRGNQRQTKIDQRLCDQ